MSATSKMQLSEVSGAFICFTFFATNLGSQKRLFDNKLICKASFFFFLLFLCWNFVRNAVVNLLSAFSWYFVMKSCRRFNLIDAEILTCLKIFLNSINLVMHFHVLVTEVLHRMFRVPQSEKKKRKILAVNYLSNRIYPKNSKFQSHNDEIKRKEKTDDTKYLQILQINFIRAHGPERSHIRFL